MQSIRDIMQRPVVTVGATESGARARQLMEAYGIGHLPVVDRGGLVGVLSRRELVRKSHGGRPKGPDAAAADDLAVEHLMNRPVVTLDSNASIGWAAALVQRLGIGCIPVVDHHQLVGIVTRRDLRPVAESAGRVASRATDG